MKDEIMTSELRKVTAEIVTLTQQGQRMALGYAIEIGRRLVTAKGLVNHGEWGAYLKENVRYSERTAQNFMQLFQAYGSDQIDLFGTSKAQTYAHLSYSQALALLAVPEEEREEFAAEVKAEELSARELKAAIEEREKAKAEAEDAKRLAEDLRSRADEELKRAKDLERELEELKSRPVEVAVQEPDPKTIEEAAKKLADEQTKMLKAAQKQEIKGITELEREKAGKARAEAQAAKEAAEKLRADLEAAQAEAKKAQEKAEAAEKLASGAKKSEEEIAALRKKLELSNPAVTEFKVHFTAAQEEIQKCRRLVEKFEGAETREKLKSALRALADSLKEG